MDGVENTANGTEQTVDTTQTVEQATATEQTAVVEQVVEATEPVVQENVKTFTEEQVQEIVRERLAREAKRVEAEQEQAKKLAKMNQTEKLQYQLQQKDAELKAMKDAQALAEMRSTASSLLANEGISANETLLGVLVTADAEQTNANINAFVELTNAKADELLQAKLKGTAPRVSSGVTQSTPTTTKEAILAIKDTAERQKAIAENLELFQ